MIIPDAGLRAARESRRFAERRFDVKTNAPAFTEPLLALQKSVGRSASDMAQAHSFCRPRHNLGFDSVAATLPPNRHTQSSTIWER